MNASKLRVAVVGGGIGGLTLAIALRRLGVEVEVFEQTPELTEIGAAVAFRPTVPASCSAWEWTRS